ncbi:MAG: VCBS repeat-containing protein, partial [Planctomycetales bacterium]|nr:VCBS repeat-containing protein [Planctomycetales bacterium]
MEARAKKLAGRGLMTRRTSVRESVRRRRHRRAYFESLEDRRMLAGDFRNAFNPFDVNDDGEIAPLDVLLLINHLNQFGAGPTDAAGVRPGTFVDTSGDDQVSPIDALLVINHLNNVTGSRLIAMRESRASLAREAERVVSLPDSSSDAGRPVLTFDLRTRLDSTSNSAASDVLNVLLFDPTDPTKPLLELGDLNAPLLAVNESRAEFDPRIVTMRQEQVEIDLSSLRGSDQVGVRIQLLSLDGDDGSRFVVENLETQTRLEPTLEFAFAETDIPTLAPGLAVDGAAFVAADQVVVDVDNVIFDSRAGRLVADIRATNRGPSLGREMIAVIEGLPSGVSVLNASGMTTVGSPFINLEPAAPRGGLRANATTTPIRVEFDVTDAPAVDFDLRIRRGALNSAPTLASLGILTMHPGEVRTIQLAATDADGDPLTFNLVPLAGQPPLPAMSLNQAGELTLRPMPDQLGSFQFEVRVSDGAVATTEVVQLDIVADPNVTTRISGVVRSTNDLPLEGVPIEIAGFSDVTGVDGAFTIELPTLKVPTESFDIPIPVGEPLFDPFNTGTQVIRFRRARHDVTTGESTQNPRQHPNLVTSFLDASVVYGSDAARAVALRTLVDGKLKTSADGLLPLNNVDTFPGGALENDNEGRVDPATLFAAGDVRANENIALIALHTILVREHNRLADEIRTANPAFDDEQIYQHARRVVGALLQQITYGEYLPMLLGSNAIPAYTGYDPDVDPRESSLFAVAAFRIGHTQTFSQFLRLDDSGQSLDGGPLALREAFFTAEPIKTDGVEPYLLGLAASQAEQVDARIIDDLRNFLFGPPGAGGIDLASLNIQRGRDMGLPSYNQARADFGLPRVIDFAEISSDASVQTALRTTFGSVNNIDVWSGGISEDHAPGSLVGPLFQKIIADQFQRTRDGDRFWFENGQFTVSEQAFIRGTTLASLIERNTSLSGLPTNLFTSDAPPDSPESAGSSADTFPGEFRSIDGAGNNLDDSQLGSTRSNLLHNFTVSYGDGISTPAGAGRPNPREISNGVHAQSQSVPNSAGATGFMVFWGQLLSHDLGLTPGGVSDTLRILGNQRPNGDGDSFPFVAERMDLLLGHAVSPGINNVIARPIFLPTLDSGTTIDPNQTTVVQAANIVNASITVAAGSLTDRTGQMFTGELSITEVPPALTPAALPANLFPDLVVTIQPADLVFTTPAPLTLPNRSNLPAGTLVDLYSINPITGEFEIVGTGQVASSGQQIETVAGGIRNSSWHFAAQQISEKQMEKKNDPAKNPLNQEEGCDRCEDLAKKLKEEPIVPSDDGNATKLQRRGETTTESTGTSEVETHSGALRESHFLVSYQSLGEERGLSLHYNSLRADPRPIFHFDAVNVSEGDVLVASLTVSRGGLELQVPGFAGGQFGLQGGEHFWDLPEGVNDVDAALQVDLRDQPTGVYDFNVAFGPRRFNGQIFAGTASTFTTPMTIINSINSPFGAGWDLAGLQQVIENPDGSVMLIGGEVTELMFKPQGAGQPFDSPAGDFSMFEELSDGSYRRTFTDQTVVLFDAGGRIASVTDRNGNQTTYNYDSDGFIATIVDPVGLTTTFTRAGDRITKITDPAARDTILEYDAEGNLTRITDPDGASRQFHYDAEHHLVGETNKRGFSEEAAYGFHGRVVSVLRKDGSRSQFESAQTVGLLPADTTIAPLDRPMIRISNQQAVARFADPLGNVTTSILDQAGQVKSSTDAEGNLPSVVRNQDNLPVVSVDGRGNATFRKFDQRGNVTEIALEQHERSPGLFDSEAFLTDARSTFVRMADFDNDGDLDVIVAHDRQRQPDQSGARFLSLFENDGAGRLTKAANVGAGVNAPETFVVGDVNNDGFLDIAFVSQLNAPNGSPNDNFRVLLGNGDLTFQQTAIIALGRDPSGIDLGDINGDGNLDAIVSHETNTNLTTLLLGDGTGEFTVQTFLPGDVTRDVRLGDINGDGNLDAVFAGQNTVRLMLGNGAGGFIPNVRLNDVNQSHDAISLVDINSDGRLDILAAGLGGVAVFENVGAGDFVESTVAIPNAIIEDIATADLNFDGHIDFVVPDRRVDTVFVFLNDGLGRFTRVEGTLPMGESPRSVALGDLDGDGFIDLANANESFANYIGVTFGKGDGRFLANVATTGPTNTNSARGSELGDVNGDGVLDLVTLLDTPGINVIDRVAVQLGDGVGGFGLEQQFEAFNDDVLFRDLAIGDLNNDGLGDVVVATGLGQRISVLLSEGNGRLAGPLLLTTASNEEIVHIADLDSDGNNDIVVAGSNDLDLSVLFGDGQGAFTETILNVPANGVNTRDALTIADVDSDGDLDIVFAANVFRIFQND